MDHLADSIAKLSQGRETGYIPVDVVAVLFLAAVSLYGEKLHEASCME